MRPSGTVRAAWLSSAVLRNVGLSERNFVPLYPVELKGDCQQATGRAADDVGHHAGSRYDRLTHVLAMAHAGQKATSREQANSQRVVVRIAVTHSGRPLVIRIRMPVNKGSGHFLPHRLSHMEWVAKLVGSFQPEWRVLITL